MQSIDIVPTGNGIKIEGLPDAVKAIRLDGHLARRLSDLWLHKVDLDFAADCLNAIDGFPSTGGVTCQALWRSAIVHYAKCFGTSNARIQLNALKVFRGHSLLLEDHKFFADLRNKHVVHDENSYALCVPAAILNRGDKNNKIEQILCLAGFIQTLSHENWSRLKLLVTQAHEWVATEFDCVHARLKTELEQQEYRILFAREDLTMRVPSLDEVGRTRDLI